MLYPFPKSRVVVQPRFGELVLFSSQQMLHRVLPSTKPRYALTTWMYHSPPVNAMAESAAFYQSITDAADQASGAEDAKFQAMVAKILRSPFRRHLVKLVYEQEWAQSLRESHLQTEAFEHYMAIHEREIEVIEDATSRMLGNFQPKTVARAAACRKRRRSSCNGCRMSTTESLLKTSNCIDFNEATICQKTLSLRRRFSSYCVHPRDNNFQLLGCSPCT